MLILWSLVQPLQSVRWWALFALRLSACFSDTEGESLETFSSLHETTNILHNASHKRANIRESLSIRLHSGQKLTCVWSVASSLAGTTSHMCPISSIIVATNSVLLGLSPWSFENLPLQVALPPYGVLSPPHGFVMCPD